MKQRRISEASTQQLLLDTYNMKTLLLHLHSVGTDPAAVKAATPLMFTKLIHTQATQVETILKLVGTPEVMLVERFRIMCPDGRREDLKAIMTLKGMKQQDQQVLLESEAAASISSRGPAGAGGSSGSSSFTFGGTSGIIPIVTGTATALPAGASMASASLAVASSVRSLTQDLSSSARSAVGNLKWK